MGLFWKEVLDDLLHVHLLLYHHRSLAAQIHRRNSKNRLEVLLDVVGLNLQSKLLQQQPKSQSQWLALILHLGNGLTDPLKQETVNLEVKRQRRREALVGVAEDF